MSKLISDGPLLFEENEFSYAEEKAYSLGFEAYACGDEQNSNPFNARELREAFNDGFYDARKNLN